MKIIYFMPFDVNTEGFLFLRAYWVKLMTEKTACGGNIETGSKERYRREHSGHVFLLYQTGDLFLREKHGGETNNGG